MSSPARRIEVPCRESLHLSNGGSGLSRDGLLHVELEHEVIAQLLLEGSLNSFEDVVEDTEGSWVLIIVALTLVNTSADETSVPSVHVTADDVGLWVVTDHVDVLWKTLLVVDSVHPGRHDLVGKLVGSHFWLTVDNTLKLEASEGLVDGLKGDTEGTLGHTWSWVLGWAEQIALGEVDWDAVGQWVLSLGAEDTSIREKEINDDLEVGSVVAGVGEDKDGVDLDLGEVLWSGSGLLLLSPELLEWRDVWIGGVDVVWNNDVLESVGLGDLTALVLLSSYNKDSLVVLAESGHRSVRLDELLGGDRGSENLGELLATLRLDLSGTVGQEDVWDLDAELVITVEDLQNTLSLWDQAVTVNEDSVNVESESHILSGSGLDLGHILHLGSEDLAGWQVGLAAELEAIDAISDLDRRGEAGATLHAWNWEGGAEGVAGASALTGRWSLGEWVHDLVSVGPWRAGGWDLDGLRVSIIVSWNRQHATELWTVLDLVGLLSWCVRHGDDVLGVD